MEALLWLLLVGFGVLGFVAGSVYRDWVS